MNHSEIVYIALDPRRAVGIQKAIGCRILTLYKSDFLDELGEDGSVFCLEKVSRKEANEVKSTSELLNIKAVQDFIHEVADSKLIVFKPSNKIRRICDDQGWKLLSPPQEVCSNWEDKITFFEKANEIGLSVPRGEVLLFERGDYNRLRGELGDIFVVQMRRGQSGNSTFIIRDENDWNRLSLKDGVRLKVSEFIKGDPLTANVCLNSVGGFVITSVWKQLTGDKRFTPYELGTFGVTPFNFDDEEKLSLRKEIAKICKAMSNEGYRGVFGVDFVLKDDTFYIIEVNARFLATVSFEIQRQKDRTSVAVHVGLSDALPDEFAQGKNSMVIFRNISHTSLKLRKLPPSSLYLLESDGWSATDDDDLAYRALRFFSRSNGSIVNSGMDYAHVEVEFPVFDIDGQIDDRILDFYERMVLGRVIRERDFWNECFARAPGLLDILREPVVDACSLNSAALRRLRQSQFEEQEVIKLLGEHNGCYLVEKFDGTRGWISRASILVDNLVEDYDVNLSDRVEPVEFLSQWKGVKYLWGGVTESGIDCSGFTQRYFKDVLGLLIPKHSSQQRALGIDVELSELDDGDLLFGYSKMSKKSIHHVGLYKNEKVWHACLKKGMVVDEDFESFCKQYAVEIIKRIIW